MGFNIAETQQKLDRLVHNITERDRVLNDMYFNTDPKDVAFEKYNEAGKLKTVTMPNFAKIKKDINALKTIIQIKTFSNNTRTALPKQDSYVFWEFEFDKQQSKSKLLIQGVLRGRTRGAHWCGIYFSYGSSGEQRDGICYAGEGHDNAPQLISINASLENHTQTGKQHFKIGWNHKNNNSWFWAGVFNPNNNDDEREHQTGSTISIIEYI
jgi:hypothetical protein